jgi:pyruvate,orthophosphate dikinase
MDTVLNVGMNDEVVQAVIDATDGGVRFAMDLYRRFLQMFGTLVLKIDHQKFEDIVRKEMCESGAFIESALLPESLINIVNEFKKLAVFPQDPFVQLRMTIEAIICSWFAPR